MASCLPTAGTNAKSPALVWVLQEGAVSMIRFTQCTISESFGHGKHRGLLVQDEATARSIDCPRRQSDYNQLLRVVSHAKPKAGEASASTAASLGSEHSSSSTATAGEAEATTFKGCFNAGNFKVLLKDTRGNFFTGMKSAVH